MLSSPPSLKTFRGTEYLRENDTHNIAGGWSQLVMTESFILTSNLQPTKDNICNLYNFVRESVSAKYQAINVNKKTFAQKVKNLNIKIGGWKPCFSSEKDNLPEVYLLP